MPIRPIVLYPNPILRMRAELCHKNDANLCEVITDLTDTLNQHSGVGIAAPQIGRLNRIIIVDATKAKRPVPNHGKLILLNPEIVSGEGHISFREGCMSIPDMVANVSRYNEVSVTAFTVDFEPVLITSIGFEAVILQHEIDHLNGTLFIDRVRSARDIKIRTS